MPQTACFATVKRRVECTLRGIPFFWRRFYEKASGIFEPADLSGALTNWDSVAHLRRSGSSRGKTDQADHRSCNSNDQQV